MKICKVAKLLKFIFIIYDFLLNNYSLLIVNILNNLYLCVIFLVDNLKKFPNLKISFSIFFIYRILFMAD